MTVMLKNTAGRMKVFNLPHDPFCLRAGTCACAELPGRPPRRLASSLTLPAGAEASGLPDAVLELPEVARAVRAGELRVRREAAPASKNPRARRAARRSGRKNRGDKR